MKETLHDAHGRDQTRLKRVFGWVVTFRDFPTGSWQTVGGDEMMTRALTLFTKGRAEFYLDGERRGDRVPGILSSEHEPVGLDGTFTLRYVEPTTRVCIPAGFMIHRGQLPQVTKIVLEEGQTLSVDAGFKALVCLGQVQIEDRTFDEESTFAVRSEQVQVVARKYTILLDFTHSNAPS